MLAGQALPLAQHLLPGGRKEGHEWVHPSLTGTSQRSLSVHLTGRKAGVWSDFASGEKGDALDLVATVLCAGSITDALEWARNWLGLTATAGPEIKPRQAPPPRDLEAEARDEAATRAKAIALFLNGQERLAGTPVAAYLAGRGIDLAQLARQPRSLRYHPAVWNRETGRRWPAMLAAVTDAAGETVSVHRTWLAQRPDGSWGKAPVSAPKMSYGRLGGGTIRLWRGASGKPLVRAPEGEAVAIGEGIETCLSVALACPDLRVLCGVALSNMALIALPPAVRVVILLKDRDPAENQAAQRGFARVVAHFLADGRTVKVAHPPIGKDFNDTLTTEAA